MKDDALMEAKRKLPLTALMTQLGYGDRARKTAKCPFHDDSTASFSLFEGRDGQPRWHCFAGCGHGDAIDFLARARNLSTADACREYVQLAGTSAPPVGPAAGAILAPAGRRFVLPSLHGGSDAELGALARLRHLSMDGLRLASARGLLRFGRWSNCSAWFVIDDTGVNAQARRLDGQPWPQGCKALTLPGSRAAWPLGAVHASRFPTLLFCEGGPDLLSANHFIIAEGRAADAAAVAMLGASLSVPPDALPYFARKRIRFFTHADTAGRTSVARWARQLAEVGARVDALALDGLLRSDGTPAKDLNDLTRVHADAFHAHPELENIIPQD